MEEVVREPSPEPAQTRPSPENNVPQTSVFEKGARERAERELTTQREAEKERAEKERAAQEKLEKARAVKERAAQAKQTAKAPQRAEPEIPVINHVPQFAVPPEVGSA